MDQNNAFELISEVLEKTIDSQVANTQALTSLRDYQRQSAEIIRYVEKEFKNGFRMEIKTHITNELEDIKKILQEHSEKINALQNTVDSFKNIKFWFKATVTLLMAVGTIFAVILATSQ